MYLYSTVYVSTTLNFVVTKNLLCSVWCRVVTHRKQPVCALLLCDCTFGYRPHILWGFSFTTNRLKLCLFAHIEYCLLNSDRYKTLFSPFFFGSLWCFFHQHLAARGEEVRTSAVFHRHAAVVVSLAFPPSRQRLRFSADVHLLKSPFVEIGLLPTCHFRGIHLKTVFEKSCSCFQH